MKIRNKQAGLFAIVLIVLFLMSVSGCHPHVAQKQDQEHHLVLTKSNFNQLPGWCQDDPREALKALQRSCVVIAKQNPSQSFSMSMPHSGKVENWQNICRVAENFKPKDASSARKFFETWFLPYRVSDNTNPEGLFTGYYLPKLNCRLKKSKRFCEPIYAIPEDWVKADLGLFKEDLKGTTIVGQVNNKSLHPYPKRSTIVHREFRKKAQVLFWCDDRIDVFFAQIQGSAIVQLPHNKRYLINYAGSNGRPYTSLGKYMVKKQYLTPQNSSMQDIKAWLLKHPKEMNSVLNQNASYVFFRVLKNKDPLGAQQVPLTPRRSLAVDKRYIPFGAPVWLDTGYPSKTPQELIPFRHLMIAQDTGGAIKGIVRGDVYWGNGEQAAYIAGHMKSQGCYWILLPRSNLN